MTIFETLAPLVILIGLGVLLSHLRFLGKEFIADLNKLAFWVALPALLFRSAAHATAPNEQTLLLFGILCGATILAAALGYGCAVLMRLPATLWGTLSQSAFRGNLAYIGIPTLTYSLSSSSAGGMISTAVVVMTLLMAFYNILAVLVLGGTHFVQMWRPVFTNPLLISGLAGLAWAASGWPLPAFADRSLEALGNAAVPIALLCIGGSLSLKAIRGRTAAIGLAVAVKVLLLPLLVWGLGIWFGLGPAKLQIALVLAACPTAAASYVMAVKMNGDGELAAATIAASTIFSAPALICALWLTT